MSVVLKLIVVLLGVVNLSNISLADSNGYTHTPGIGIYKLHAQGTTWNEARRTCKEEGGHLAIVNSVAEAEFINQRVRTLETHSNTRNRHSVYIGIHELYGDGDWVTIHGDSLAKAGFATWLPGEPNHNENNAKCGALFSGEFDDVTCATNLAFVCELPYDPSVEEGAVIRPTQRQRPVRRDDYTYTPNIGGHKVHTQATNWNSARKICEEEGGGHLAIINSAAESEIITGLVANSGSHNGSIDPNWLHMGFHDLFHEGQYVTVNGESIEEVGFNEWANGEPNNGRGVENCGSIYKNGKLNDVSCKKSLGFVCELPYLKPNP